MKLNRSTVRATLMLASLPALLAFGREALADDPPAAPAPSGSASQAEPAPPPPAAPAARPEKETNCKDRIDEDGDTVVDCADSDCYNAPECRPSGLAEKSNSLCSDFVDNDGDGSIDCEDNDCHGPGISVCKGSYKGTTAGMTGANNDMPMDLPELGQGVSVEELIGKGSDKDGERNDTLCSDGIDNDNDGRTDCADFGCRFDPSVSVCTGNPGVRFSIVSQITQSHMFQKAPTSTAPDDDTRFSALQLRALGPVKGLNNSFFLLSMRAEKTPRLTFAMFQVRISEKGHYLNINSGGGGLTAEGIRSISKAPLVEPAYYMLSSFEGGNGAAAEIGGPIDSMGRLQFRTFVAGGAGRWSGNVGGRYFVDNNTNYTYGGGAQVTFNIVGNWSRYDTPILYVPVPLTVALNLGGKFDVRQVERYPAGNVQSFIRWKRLSLSGEFYGKRELEFKTNQMAWNVTAGVLLWPKHFFLAADYGQYRADEMANPPADLSSDIAKQRDEQMARAALHWFFYQNVGVMTAMYKYRDVKATRDLKDGYKEEEARLVAQFWF